MDDRIFIRLVLDERTHGVLSVPSTDLLKWMDELAAQGYRARPGTMHLTYVKEPRNG